MHTVAAQDKCSLESFAKKWGWKNASVNWREAIANPEIQLVDITAQNHMHREMAIAAPGGRQARRLREAAGGEPGRCPADARCGEKI